MSNQNNNQVEDLKTYKVVRTINWREDFSEEVQAKNEEEASTKAKILFLKELEEWVMTPQQMYDMTTEEVEDLDTSLKTYIVEVAYPDYLYLKVVATSEKEAFELVEHSSDMNQVPETFDQEIKEIGVASPGTEVGVIKSSIYTSDL